MFRFSCLLFILGFACLSCKSEDKKILDATQFDAETQLETRYTKFLQYNLDSTAFARSYASDKKEINNKPSKDWTSGFFAGNFWQIYMLTGNEAYKERAKQWTAFIEKEKYNDGTHDMGFKIYCSFGNGLKVEDNPEYKTIIIKSAETLSTRFNENVGSICSWDFGKDRWKFPVIIDNMMNLELLFDQLKFLAIVHSTTLQ